MFGQQQSPRQQQLDWGYAELAADDAADLAGAELELIGDRLDAGMLSEPSFLQTLHDQLRDSLRIVHRRASRRELGAASQARAEARLFGLLRRVEEAAVAGLGSLDAADRPAIDPGRGDADEEEAVEPRVACRHCVVQAPMVLHHAIKITSLTGRY